MLKTNAENGDYEDIYNDVKTYGTVSDNTYKTQVGKYSIPECGAQK